MGGFTKGEWWFRFYAGDAELIASMRKHGQEPVRMLTNEGQAAVMCGDEAYPSRIALVDCHVDYKRGKGGETECAERDANAKLICDAPAMYALIERVAQHFDGTDSPLVIDAAAFVRKHRAP